MRYRVAISSPKTITSKDRPNAPMTKTFAGSMKLDIPARAAIII